MNAKLADVDKEEDEEAEWTVAPAVDNEGGSEKQGHLEKGVKNTKVYTKVCFVSTESLSMAFFKPPQW